MAKTIVFANQKGGVGKTTSTVNIGAYMAEAGKKVLLIDFDPQSNLSSNLGMTKADPGIYEVLTGKALIRDCIKQSALKNLSIIPATINLTGTNVELSSVEGREFFLRERLQEVSADWDYILIDSPPSLGVLTINGLTAADFVVIPLQCEYFAAEGLSLLLKTIQKIQKSTNPHLKVGGIVFTMFDSRTRLANEVVEKISGYFSHVVFRTIIPRNVRLSEAPSHGQPINMYNPECVGAKSYRELAKEVMSRV